MKNLIFFYCFFFSCLFAQVSTFSDQKADWSCSGDTKNPQVIDFLQKNWKEGSELSLQKKAENQGLSVEFLWKVGTDQIQSALDSSSSFLTGQKPDVVEVVFYINGRGEIILYSQGKICGKVRCWTSTKRVGEFRQLTAGEYKVTRYNSKGYSKTFDSPMPNQVLLSGEAATRGISIHTGDISGEKTGINEYHGCIRVGKLVGQQFGQLLLVGTTVKVVWR